MSDCFAELRLAVERGHLSRVIPQWQAFSVFCKEVLGIEPLVVMKAFCLMDEEPQGPGTGSQECEASGENPWMRNWQRRFRT